jgi:hypothetical protein
MLTLLLVGTSCWINITNRIVAFAVQKQIKIVIPGAGTTFPEVPIGGWYKGWAPVSITLAGVADTFIVCFAIGWRDSTFHVGIDASYIGDHGEIIGDYQTDSLGQVIPGSVVGVPNLAIDSVPGQGEVLEVSNPSPSDSVKIDRLEYAISPIDIPLDSLNYYNPLVQGLSWNILVSTTTDLLPGDTLIFDVPDGPPSDPHLYGRALTSTPSGIAISEIVWRADIYPGGCEYVVGDVNGSDNYNGLDITYGVAYFKGGNAPMCVDCPLCPGWWYCGDVNGSCNYNGLDITYGVNYFKGVGPNPMPCDDCPPTD